MEDYNLLTKKSMKSSEQIEDLQKQLDYKDKVYASELASLRAQLDTKKKEFAIAADYINQEFMKSDKQIEDLQEHLDNQDQKYASLHAQYVNQYNENAQLREQLDMKMKYIDRKRSRLDSQAMPSDEQIIDYYKHLDIQDLKKLRESAAKSKEEAKLREEIQSKSAKLPQVPVRGPRTEPPILPPTRFNHPTEGNEGNEGNEGKSDKKLRWEQQRRDKPP